jgi:hypothetical protein
MVSHGTSEKKMMGTGDTPMTSETSMMMVNGGSYYA